MHLEGVHGFGHDRRRIADLTRHRQCASFDARDVDQVSDQAVHPRSRTLDTPGVSRDLLHDICLQGAFFYERRGSDDPIEEIS